MSEQSEAEAEEHPSIRRTVVATWSSLEPHTRRKIVVFAVAAAVLAGGDAVAVGLLPTLVNRFQGKSGGRLPHLTNAFVGGTVVALFVAKSIGGALLLYWQSVFIAHDESERTIRLFGHLLRRPYGETSDTNTSEFVRDLHVSLPLLYRGAAAGLATLLADGLALLGLAVVVVFSRPLTGLTLLAFFVLAAWLYNALVRARISQLSVRMHQSNRDFLNDLNESFGGLKTIKAFASEDVVSRRFARTRREFALAARDFTFYTQIPRYYLEIALVIGLAAGMAVTYAADGRGAVLTSFGLLSGVAARAMPALSRALYSLTVAKVAGASVLALEPDLRQMEAMEEVVAAADIHVHGELDGPRATTGKLVSLDGVSFRYPGATGDALRNVSLELQTGELVAILGESGAGKTTLVDVLIGLLSPQGGTVQRPATTSVGYVAQETFVWDESVRFNVALERAASGVDVDAEIWASLEAAQLADWVRGLPDGLDAPMGERGSRISGGQRQRLGLARALYGHPSILVLDEPTSALDAETSHSLLATLVAIKADVGIIVVSHDPIVMAYSDRTITLGAAAGRTVG